VAGTLLYYGRAVDSTILTSLSSLATKHAKPMQKTMETVKQLLDYCPTQDEAIITYLASKMILNVHSNAGYLNEKKAYRQASGHFSYQTMTRPPQQWRNPNQHDNNQRSDVISG
jgi:hypothetical protein